MNKIYDKEFVISEPGGPIKRPTGQTVKRPWEKLLAVNKGKWKERAAKGKTSYIVDSWDQVDGLSLVLQKLKNVPPENVWNTT